MDFDPPSDMAPSEHIRSDVSGASTSKKKKKKKKPKTGGTGSAVEVSTAGDASRSEKSGASKSAAKKKKKKAGDPNKSAISMGGQKSNTGMSSASRMGKDLKQTNSKAKPDLIPIKIPTKLAQNADPDKLSSVVASQVALKQEGGQDEDLANLAKALLKVPSLTLTGKMAKIGLFVFNVMILITGTILMAMGLWFLSNPDIKTFQSALFNGTPAEHHIKLAVYAFLAIGMFIMLVAFLGCYGAYKEHNVILSIYVICLVIIFFGELAIAILSLVYRVKTENVMRDNIAQVFSKGRYKEGNKVAAAWDIIHQKLQCCGNYNHSDFWVIKFKADNQRVPQTCCVLKKKTSGKPVDVESCQIEAGEEYEASLDDEDNDKPDDGLHDDNPDNGDSNNDNPDSGNDNKVQKKKKYKFLKTQGCFDTILNTIKNNMTIILGVVFGIVFVELMAIVTALCVCCNRRNQSTPEEIFEAVKSQSLAMCRMNASASGIRIGGSQHGSRTSMKDGLRGTKGSRTSIKGSKTSIKASRTSMIDGVPVIRA